jgi:large subunit ribosomal protein L4
MAAPQVSYLGKKSGKVTLDEAVFSESFHEPLVHRAVTAELNARRRGTASTLSRGQVAMTGAKAWRQKGTGRARAGALSSPQRTGGGVAFGPKPRSYTVKVNRKERRRALRAALSVHAERGSLGALDAGSFSAPSTKQAAEALAGFGEGGHVLVVLIDGEENAALSFRNLPRVRVLRARDVGVADVIGAARLAASPGAFEELATLATAPAARVVGSDDSSPAESEAA